MIQYVLIAPSYISVLNVYAFCNTHDIVRSWVLPSPILEPPAREGSRLTTRPSFFCSQSWGTKGQDKVSMDLGVVTSGKGGDAQSADVNVTVEATDLNAEFDDASESGIPSRFLFSLDAQVARRELGN
jgi:chitin synthase